MPFCPQCGAQMPENSKFCHVCGAKAVAADDVSQPVKETSYYQPEPGPEPTPEPVPEPVPEPEPAPGPQPAPGPGPIPQPTQSGGGYTGPTGGYTNPVGGYTAPAGTSKPPQKPAKKPMDKKMLAIILGASGVGLVLLIVLIVVLAGRRNKVPDFDTVRNEIIQEMEQEQEAGIGGDTAVTGPGPVQADTSSYSGYQNSNVKFSIEYPDACTVSEPYDNSAVFSDGDGFQVAVEYSYVTAAQDAFIYDAEDFNDMFQANNAVLTDYLGITDVTMRSQGDLTAADEEGVYYDLESQLNGRTYAVSLYVLDGRGDFGVYTVMVLMDESSDKIDQYRAWEEHMMGTFSIDGAYEPAGYGVHEAYDVDADYIVSDGTFAKEEDETATVYQFYPVEKVYSEARVVIDDTAYSASKDPTDVMEGVTGYYAKKSNAQYTSQLSQFHRGRYDYYTIDMSYVDGGETYGLTAVIFQQNGEWWQAYGIYTSPYKDAVMSALNEVLMSLKPD